MINTSTLAKLSSTFALLAALAACGGGGGGSTPPPPAEPPLSTECQAGSVARLVYTAAPEVNSNAEVSLLSCSGSPLSDVQWAATGGPALTLMSARSQALNLVLPSSGNYSFSVRYKDDSGNNHSGTASFQTVASVKPEPSLVLRGEPSVWSGVTASVRAWAPFLSDAERASASITWTIADGPSTTLANPHQWQLVLKAPTVSQDSIMVLHAAVSLPSGRQFTHDFHLLVQPQPHAATNPLFNSESPPSRVYPYLANGPHAAALQRCVYSPQLTNSNLCTLATLPLLGQETLGQPPTVDQVMQHVLVSNDWMGEVFENFLRTQDVNGDFRRMLGATTAVVIGGRVRPAFYWQATGAIYIDASFLWLTPEQRDTISEAADPRSDYGSELGFATFWRYVKDNQYAGGRYPVVDRPTRDINQLPYTLGDLLYHELTHAADFIPPASHAGLDTRLQVWQAVASATPSDDLHRLLPFYSSQMVALGRVQFFGETATAQQKAFTPDDIINFFSTDRVTDDYNYSWPSGQSVPREDAAMLAEEALMQIRYGVLRDFAITPQVASGSTSADTVVRWGQRGRIGEAAIKPRAALVLARTMPWLPASALDSLAAPLPLKAGLTWGQNLDQAAIQANRPRSLNAAERQLDADQDSRHTQQRSNLRRAARLNEGSGVNQR